MTFFLKYLLATKDKYSFCPQTCPCLSPSRYLNLANAQHSRTWNFQLSAGTTRPCLVCMPGPGIVQWASCSRTSTQGQNPVFAPLTKLCAVAGGRIHSQRQGCHFLCTEIIEAANSCTPIGLALPRGGNLFLTHDKTTWTESCCCLLFLSTKIKTKTKTKKNSLQVNGPSSAGICGVFSMEIQT